MSSRAGWSGFAGRIWPAGHSLESLILKHHSLKFYGRFKDRFKFHLYLCFMCSYCFQCGFARLLLYVFSNSVCCRYWTKSDEQVGKMSYICENKYPALLTVDMTKYKKALFKAADALRLCLNCIWLNCTLWWQSGNCGSTLSTLVSDGNIRWLELPDRRFLTTA